MKIYTFAAVALAMVLSGCSDKEKGMPNQAPVIQIDAQQDIKANQQLVLNANASDVDGSIASYEWKEGDTLLATTEEFVYTSDTPGEHILTLTVTDNKGATETKTITVVVAAANQVPLADAGEDRQITLGETLALVGKGNDSDGNVVSYLWKEGEVELAQTAALNYVPTVEGVHTLTLIVTDNDGATKSDDVAVSVSMPNTAPLVNAGENVRVAVGEGITLTGEGSDSDGSIVSYEWKEADTILATVSAFSYVPTSAGVHTLTLTVTDNDGVSVSDTLTVEAFIPNQPPLANAGVNRSVEVNHSVRLTGSGSDSDGNIVAYEWKEGNNVLADTAAFTYIPTALGGHTLTFTVTDDDGLQHSDTVVVTARQHVQATTPPKPSKPGKPVVVEKKATQWYIRLVAEDPARSMKTVSAQLGELEAEDTVTKHTLKALNPFGGTYLDVVFKDPAGVESGEYKVNFHKYDDGTNDRWSFTVKTDENNINADILLTWRGVYLLKSYTDKQNRKRYSEYRSTTNPIIKHMKLVDSATGEEMPAVVDGKVQTYTFNMEGSQTRTFEWVVQTDEVTLPAQQSKLSTLQAKVLKKEAKVQSKQIQEVKAESFDLSKPPMFK
jgi:hypothetical protein